MKELREYAQLSSWSPTNGDPLKLYQMALSGYTRKEAREAFLISENHFNVLYKKLKDKMVQGVLDNSLKDLNRIQRLQFGIRKQYETAMMMIQTDKKAAGIPLARATMRKAEKYGLYQVALDLSRELRRYYGTILADTKLYDYYTEKQHFFVAEVQYELEAEDVFFDFGFRYKKGLSNPNIEKKLAKLASIPAKSYRFHYMRFICQALHQQIVRKEEAMLNTCKEALVFFEAYEDLPYVVRFSFYFRAIAVHLARREFHLAEPLINKSLEGPAPGRRNWQIIMLHRVLLGFHSNKPAIAFDAWRKASTIPKKFRTAEMEERWRIIRAYLELFDFPIPGNFRLGRFLNSLQFTDSDKPGHYISVVIVELLHLLRAGKYGKYQQRSERLDDLIDIHLKGKDMERSINFLRLLQCVVRGGFRRDEVVKKAGKYLHNLDNSHPVIGADVREVEVVPFTVLWEMTLLLLK